MEKTEKQINPKVMNVLKGKLTLNRFGFNEQSSGHYIMVKQVLIEQR